MCQELGFQREWKYNDSPQLSFFFFFFEWDDLFFLLLDLQQVGGLFKCILMYADLV